ncbi:MAG: formylglycine-generating enzyme family protein, partial [Candidatus Competibacterales bacterium]
CAKRMRRDPYGLYDDFENKGISQRMRYIPPGEFLMGSPRDEPERYDEELQHPVEITRGYWLADTTCTQALWRAVMDDNPSFSKGDDRPVERVTWSDTQSLIAILNKALPGGDDLFRLPTEAEWEYACRAGTTTPFWFGEQITPEQVNYDGNYPYADGKQGLYRQQTVAVQALPCNAWGLYQMHGNVLEWCWDWLSDYRPGRVRDPVGPASGDERVLRGGYWYGFAVYCRSADRNASRPADRSRNVGFRLARGHVMAPADSKQEEPQG